MATVIWRALFLILLVGVSSSADAAFICFCSAPSPTAGWQILPEGAGGFITGLSVANDDTMVSRTDTYGAYLWNPTATYPNCPVTGLTGCWQQLVNSNSMPAGFVSEVMPALADSGIYEIQVAANNSSIMYMIQNVYISNQNPPYQTVYKSTNKGQTWIATAFSSLNFEPYFGGDSASTNAPIKAWGPKLSIDPTDSNAQTVYVGTGANGLWVTTTGGTSWSQVSASSVPVALTDSSSNYPGYVVVMSGYTAGDVIVFSYGNGVYLKHSGSWSNISSGGPSIVTIADIDPVTGIYYCTDGAGNAWKYVIGTGWTEIYTAGGTNAYDIAVDHDIASGAAANHIIIANGLGHVNESTNAGSSWGGWSNACNPCTTTGDVGWLDVFSADDNGLYFDRTTAKTLLNISNRGIWKYTYSGSISSSTTMAWNAQSRGVEQLVGVRVTACLTGQPLTTSWDSPLFWPSFTSYPSTFYPGTYPLVAGWDIDCSSSNPNYVFANVDGSVYSNGTQASAYSTNGGLTWTPLPSQAVPPNAYPNGGQNGSIASTAPADVLFAAAGGVVPYYTTNCCTSGTTWTAVSISGATCSNFFTSTSESGARYVCADKGAGSSTYWLYFNGVGFYSLTGNGATATKVASYTTGAGSNQQIKCTPGEAGDFWYSGGVSAGADQGACGQPLLHYYSGSVTTITNVSCPSSVGFGYNSGGYPSVFIAGWVSGVYGIWESDNASTGSTPTWTQIGPWPFNSLNSVRNIDGDPGVHGRAYVSFPGSGFAHYNYLLNRDLDPANNDNSPAFVYKVA
jgi:xyloglucan-specific exo-beta-1,4-glucanase